MNDGMNCKKCIAETEEQGNMTGRKEEEHMTEKMEKECRMEGNAKKCFVKAEETDMNQTREKKTEKTVKELIKDTGIWAGQNKPGIAMEEADLVVFSIPFDKGVSFRSGAKAAPQTLRNITFTIPPTTEEFESFDGVKILDLGDMEGRDREEIFANAEEAAYRAVKAGKLFTMIGGDHSVTIPVQRGIDRALEEPFGIIHIDAHCDLSEEMHGDRLSHGSTEKRALELKNITGPENLFFLGIRSVELDELELIRERKFHILSAKTISEQGVEETLRQVLAQMKDLKHVYITLDIDGLDPAYAAGTGTPQFGGLTAREVLTLLRGLFQLPVIGFDVVEVAPSLDPALASVFAARKIITECWGHHLRKLGMLK